MTEQEAFDIATMGVIRQGEPSAFGSGCFYRFRGLKCAAGHLIPDDEYIAALDDVEALAELCPSFDSDLGTPFAVIAELFPGLECARHVGLVTALQCAHDEASRYRTHFVHEFSALAIRVAKNFNLSTAAMDAVLAEVSRG